MGFILEGNKSNQVKKVDLYFDEDYSKIVGSINSEKDEMKREKANQKLLCSVHKDFNAPKMLNINRSFAKKKRKKQVRPQTSGSGWFNLPNTPITEENKTDIELLNNRRHLFVEKQYRKDGEEEMPKFFQVGTIMDNPRDFYNSRIPKKERQRTITDEILKDFELKNKMGKKYDKIVEKQQKIRFAKRKLSSKKKSQHLVKKKVKK